jgi:ABC-type dipeptide/oligopeptide/nickel transport system ATPase component
MSAREMRRVRGSAIGMILQDPMASLNPLFNIYTRSPSRPTTTSACAAAPCADVEDCCGLCATLPAMRMRSYPHQMSGGMRQRIVGAIALAGGPAYHRRRAHDQSRRHDQAQYLTCSWTSSRKPAWR